MNKFLFLHKIEALGHKYLKIFNINLKSGECFSSNPVIACKHTKTL